jgi:phosphotransferase system HPr (HPr) family protein
VQKAIVTITVDIGLHARPAALFVQTAKKLQSDIHVKHGEKEANAKSIMQVLTLGVKQNGELEITADGPDEKEAIQTLTALVKSDFKE